jgi:phospholipid-translocating ATPase
MAPSISAWTAKLNPQTLFSRRHIPSTARSVFVNQPLPSDYYDAKGRAKKEHVYATNQVLTSKYTIITFLPRNLLEQFRRVANVLSFLFFPCKV